MAKKRAPNCPSLSLPDAIEKVECVYSDEGRNTFDGESAVKRIGYAGLNGASRRALGALRSFGLIVGRGNNLQVSEDAIVIIADALAPDQTERQAAILRSLRFNRVFADLVDNFGPGSTLIKITSYLQKHYEFKTGAARRTAKMYKDSVALVHWSGSSDSVASMATEDRHSHAIPAQEATSGQTLSDEHDVDTMIDKGTVHSPKLTATELDENFNIDEGTVHLGAPKSMSAESFEDFTDWLLIMHRRIARGVVDAPDFTLKKKQNG